jgi:hypothetical protein
MVTVDSDILMHRARLESLLKMRIFHPERDAASLREIIGQFTA